MVDLIQINGSRKQGRYKFLATVSSMALIASASAAKANDADDPRPTFWIVAGGAFEQLGTDSDLWLAPNTPASQTNPTPPFGTLPKVGYDTDLQLSIVPRDSDWKFSVSIAYGRSLRGHKTSHDQTYNETPKTFLNPPKYVPTNWNFINTQQSSSTSHLVLDFQAGKDVGVGIFGGESRVNVGIRWAKLNETSSGHMSGATNATYPGERPYATETREIADFLAKHSFNGIGPSISWDSSVPFAGSLSDGFSLDWGVNAALLFGKQKARVSLHTKSAYYGSFGYSEHAHTTQTIVRKKNVFVPNVGGFAGISWRLPNAKISMGYKADFFFNAIDAGVYTRDTATRGFYGPFANISIGLGG